MFSKEEKKLVNYKNQFNEIEIPLEKIDEAIFAGFQKAKSETKPKNRKWLYGALAAAVILVGFFTSIRVSPAFADYIKIIPGMERIVDLIRDDKGKMLAVENDYYEKLGVSEEKDGVKVTIDGAIADKKGMVLFYTIHSKNNLKEPGFEKMGLKALDNGTVDIGGFTYESPRNVDKQTYNGTIQYNFQKSLSAKKFEADFLLTGNRVYALQFQLQKGLKVKKSYSINKTVTIEGQKVSVVDTEIYPLQVAVHLKMDPNNTKKLLDFEDVRLVDENGETWNKIANGITSTKVSDDEVILYLQSNYFREPKELYLILNKIQAVDKTDAYVLVDTIKQQILKQPKGNLLTDLKITDTGMEVNLHKPKEFHGIPFGKLIDGNGNELQTDSMNESESDGVVKTGIVIKNLASQKNPISLELSYYPAWIKGEEKIKIK